MPESHGQPDLRATSRAAGASFARIASTLFLLSGGFALASALQILLSGTASASVHTAFPITFYGAWVCAVIGGVCTILALFVYSFRARWFWRMLLFAALLWATLPPLGTAVGFVSLCLLFATRRAFPLDSREASAL